MIADRFNCSPLEVLNAWPLPMVHDAERLMRAEARQRSREGHARPGRGQSLGGFPALG